MHFGSLVSAVGSFIDAKANQGKWLIRIDNIDPPREKPNAITQILQSLKAFSLHHDDEIIYQSTRVPDYLKACVALVENDLAYPCTCSRKDLAVHKKYPGTCDKTLANTEKTDLINSLEKDIGSFLQSPNTLPQLPIKNYALRLRVDPSTLLETPHPLNFIDNVQGAQNCPEHFGDFIILRKDRLPSYMLACAIDDMLDNISHIVRGSDLLESCFWQRYLQTQLVKLPTHKLSTLPAHYTHLPLIINEYQQKLSKQHHADEIDSQRGRELLYLAIVALGQKPDPQLRLSNHQDILQWAIKHWNVSDISTDNIVFDKLFA